MKIKTKQENKNKTQNKQPPNKNTKQIARVQALIFMNLEKTALKDR